MNQALLTNKTNAHDNAAPPLRVVFLSAKSGGGHDGTARALLYWLEQSSERAVEAQILDIYGGGLKLLPWMARVRAKSNFIWRGFCRVTEHPWILRGLTTLLRPLIVRRVLQQMQIQPDLLIAVHFACAQSIDDVAKKLPRRPQTLTLASDYFPHRAWFGSADLTVVPSLFGIELGAKFGHPAERLFSVPFLPCGAIPSNTVQDCCNRLRVLTVMGMDATSGAKLVVLLQRLDQQDCATAIDMHIVCANNLALLQQLTALARGLHSLKLTLLGHVTDLPQRLLAADVALLRLSPLVMTEALGAGVPVVAFDWHVHEEGNVRVLQYWSAHAVETTLADAVDAAVLCLCEFVRRPGLLQVARSKAREAAMAAFNLPTIRAICDRLNAINATREAS